MDLHYAKKCSVCVCVTPSINTHLKQSTLHSPSNEEIGIIAEMIKMTNVKLGWLVCSVYSFATRPCMVRQPGCCISVMIR